MRKLSDYVEMAAEEYWQETGKHELDSLWIAEFFQDCGVLNDHPKQDLLGFYALVQKVLTRKIERAEKLARLRHPCAILNDVSDSGTAGYSAGRDVS